MKATGIIRRVNDLGQVVIPKEIRRTMRIREGDSLEIFTSSDGEVIFKKYSELNDFLKNAEQCAEVLLKITGCHVAISDCEHIVAVAGLSKRDMIDSRISSEVEGLIEYMRTYVHNAFNRKQLLPIVGSDNYAIACVPITTHEGAIGTIMLFPTDKTPYATFDCLTALNTAAMFLAKLIKE